VAGTKRPRRGVQKQRKAKNARRLTVHTAFTTPIEPQDTSHVPWIESIPPQPDDSIGPKY
jgi:hypothetical protein